MAKLATPHLKDVAPTPQGLATVVDRVTDVGLIGSPLTGARLVLSNEQGAPSAVVMLTIANGQWADCSIAVLPSADAAVIGRLNRLLNGYTIQHPTLPVLPASTLRVEKYWRTKAVAARLRRDAIPAPFLGEAKPHIVNGAVRTLWTVRSKSVVIEPNAALGYVPVQGASSAVSRTKVRRTRAVKRNQPTSSVTPKGVTATPVQSSIPAPKKPVASRLPANHPGIFREIPRGGMTVHVEPKVQRKLEAAYAGFLRGERTVVALRGPSGAGKTITAEWLAQKHDLPFWKVDVAALRDFSDWVGSMSLRPGPNGDVITEFVPSQFAEAIASDGPYGGIPRIVLLDDATRAETAGAMNALIPTLDGRGSIYVPDARKSIAIDPAVFFIATMNIGSGFTGAVTMDAAVANRATGWLEVSYPSNTVEATILVEQTGVDRPSATKLVAVALQVRAMAQRGEIETGVSTRQLVATAHHVVSGLNLVEACEFGFGESYSPDGEASSERTKVLSAINAVLR